MRTIGLGLLCMAACSPGQPVGTGRERPVDGQHGMGVRPLPGGALRVALEDVERWGYGPPLEASFAGQVAVGEQWWRLEQAMQSWGSTRAPLEELFDQDLQLPALGDLNAWLPEGWSAREWQGEHEFRQNEVWTRVPVWSFSRDGTWALFLFEPFFVLGSSCGYRLSVPVLVHHDGEEWAVVE